MLKNPQKLGGETTASTNNDNIQTSPTSAALKNGDYVVVWTDLSGIGGDASGSAIKQQHFDALGNKVGAETLVNTTTSQDQARSSVTVLSDGSYVVTWDDNSQLPPDTSSLAIRARHFSQDGTAVGNDFVVNTTTMFTQAVPSIAALPTGGFLVTWQDKSGTSADMDGYAIRAQRFDATMSKVGPELLVNTTTVGNQQGPNVIVLNDGSTVIAWDDDANNGDVRARQFDPQGVAVGNDFALSATLPPNQGEVKLAPLTNGGFVAVWIDGANSNHLTGQVFDASHAKVGGEFMVNTNTLGLQGQPSVTELKEGGFFVSWTDVTPGASGSGPNGYSIRGEAFDNSANKIGHELLINTTVTADVFQSHVTELASGHLVVNWTTEFTGNPVPGAGIYSQILNPTFAPSDLNADGNSDILWRNVNGTTVVWEMNGGAKLADLNLNAIPTDWSIQDTGDFNGDGHADILWRNINGSTVVWEMNGGQKIADLNLNTISTDWSVQGSGDFNSDGMTDIIWRRASDGQTVLWEMNGAQKLLDVNLNVIPTEWHIQGSGDFNADDRSDILWRRASDGQTVLWEMNGGTKIADLNLNAITTDWHVAGIGDFNGDGKSDILWRNNNGTTVLWEMNGGVKIADVNLSTISTDWHVAAIGDYNGDGKSDIVWRNDNGQTVLWELNGQQKLADINLGSIPADWSLFQHHYDIV